MKEVIFFMRLALNQKRMMCEKHIIKGKSLSHASEVYGGYDIESLTKEIVNVQVHCYWNCKIV